MYKIEIINDILNINICFVAGNITKYLNFKVPDENVLYDLIRYFKRIKLFIEFNAGEIEHIKALMPEIPENFKGFKTLKKHRNIIKKYAGLDQDIIKEDLCEFEIIA
ncbi:MAG: hypothetical protein CMH64_01655 [Nanoarchaeota archaeon]|jgi:hypothetical protein|nr:hypothetical protein [Nanoarchaeota archaeon]|tara:strand:+ start:5379 stop:5699 length:321 start_codon:yes stop_codon:yes gene_type:complete